MAIRPSLYIFSLCLLMASGSHAAGNAGLWSGAADLPPESIKIQSHSPEEGSFRFVPMPPVHFDSDKATLTHEGQLALDAAVEYIKQHSDIKRLLIEGHTDWVGSAKYNDRLSDRRSEIVRNYLTIKGVDPLIMNILGKSEHAPVDENWTREGRSRNRQVSIYAIRWNQ